MVQFTCNTKPLADALALGVIDANISNFHKKSTIVQLTVTESGLKINIESNNVYTEMKLNGKVEGVESAVAFLDCALFKKLVNTIDTSTVTLQFNDDGVTVVSGKSKFVLPKMVDSSDFSLRAPAEGSSEAAKEIKKDNWKFIKDYQMYAISMAFIHPVYTRVWVGESGDVIVGDFDLSLFTLSKKSELGATCLLTDTIINLFVSLPDGAKIQKVDRDYVISVKTDSFTYRTEFAPMYESDEGVGSYHSDIFLDIMKHAPEEGDTFACAPIVKLLNQATLLSTSNEDSVTISVADGELTIHTDTVDGKVPADGIIAEAYSAEFKLDNLKNVINNYDSEKIHIKRTVDGEDTSGILVWNDQVTTIIARADQ